MSNLVNLVGTGSSLASLELLEVVRARVHVVGWCSEVKRVQSVSPELVERSRGCGESNMRLTALKTPDEVLALYIAVDANVLLLLVVSLGSGLLGRLSGSRAASTEEHAGEAVANGGADSDTSGGRGHLAEQTGSLRLLSHGRRVLGILRRRLVVLLVRGSHGVSTARSRRGGSGRAGGST